jgi:hypothetical protein
MPSDQRKDYRGKSLPTIFAVRSAIILAAAAAAVALAPVAHADPGCFDSSDPTCGGHSWNGPLRQTWDTPGYYGGWNMAQLAQLRWGVNRRDAMRSVRQ